MLFVTENEMPPADILIALERELQEDETPTAEWKARRREAEARLAATPAVTLADLRAKARAILVTLDACDRELVLSLARDVAAYSGMLD